MSHVRDDIAILVDNFREAAESGKNQKNAALWNSWPKRVDGSEPFAITIEPELPMWGDILEFGLLEFYANPEEYLRRNLQMALYRFQRWDENTPLEKRVRIWLGVTFEGSLFGAETRYGERGCPWLAGHPVVRCKDDFHRLEQPDFRTSGLMPKAHEFYSRLREILPDDFAVDFPAWERSPFGVCNHLRGTQELLVDMLADPDFAHQQIAFMTGCRKQWFRDMANFFGRDIEPGVLLNDEVNSEMLRPDMYEEFILPGEIELDRFQRITYWHSCANVTSLLPLIRRINGLQVFHVGPWTNRAAAAQEMDGVALQVCLDPVREVQRASDEHIIHSLRNIVSVCRDTTFTVRVDGLHTIDTLDTELKAIDRWLELARRVRRELAQDMKA